MECTFCAEVETTILGTFLPSAQINFSPKKLEYIFQQNLSKWNWKKKLLNIWNTKASFGYLERAFLGGWFNPSWGLVQGDPSCFPWGGADWSSQLIEEPRSGKNKIDHIYSFFLHQILMIYRRRFAENLGHIEISGDVFGLHCFQKLLVPWVGLSLPVREPWKRIFWTTKDDNII